MDRTVLARMILLVVLALTAVLLPPGVSVLQDSPLPSPISILPTPTPTPEPPISPLDLPEVFVEIIITVTDILGDQLTTESPTEGREPLLPASGGVVKSFRQLER